MSVDLYIYHADSVQCFSDFCSLSDTRSTEIDVYLLNLYLSREFGFFRRLGICLMRRRDVLQTSDAS